MTTTLAAVRLMPIPPASVESRKTLISGSPVKSSTRDCRSSTRVVPVRITHLMPR
jgi:hypothetical protein